MAAVKTTGHNLFETLEKLASEITGVPKKSGEAHTEPEGNGACGSDTQSPTAREEDHCETASTGFRAAEMTKSVEEQGKGSIDGAPDASTGYPSAESRQADVGLTASGIGNDSALEKGFGGNLKEPGVGTSTDAKFDDGHKYAAEFRAATLPQKFDRLSKLGNEILAEVASSGKTVTAAAQVTAGPGNATPATPSAAADALIKESQAGYELASILGMQKLSHTERAAITVRQTINDGIFDADLVGQWFTKLAEAEEDAAAAAEGNGDGSKKGAPGGAAPAVPPTDPLPPPGGDAGGGDMGAGGGAMGAGGDAGGGEMNRDQILQELLMAMQEMGITPEDLMQAASGGADAMGMAPGGAPPMGGAPMPPPGGGGDPLGAMGGGPPMPPPGGAVGKTARLRHNATHIQSIAKQAKDFQRSGRFEIKVAATPQEREARLHMKSMLREMMQST